MYLASLNVCRGQLGRKETSRAKWRCVLKYFIKYVNITEIFHEIIHHQKYRILYISTLLRYCATGRKRQYVISILQLLQSAVPCEFLKIVPHKFPVTIKKLRPIEYFVYAMQPTSLGSHERHRPVRKQFRHPDENETSDSDCPHDEHRWP